MLTHRDVETLNTEIREDTSLSTCKKLADQIARGYYWLGVLFHRETDVEALKVDRIVLPKNQRHLRLEHDDTGNLSAKIRRVYTLDLHGQVLQGMYWNVAEVAQCVRKLISQVTGRPL